jgi:23S rRNA (pseudouridine1915-N3)-methyltransferase
VKLHILAIGRLKGEAESSLVEDYLKRLRGLARRAGMTRIDMREFPESRAQTAAERMRAEGFTLSEALPPDAVTVVLDERGKSISSEDFARRLARLRDEGAGDVAFLIGGPDGHGEELRKKAALLLSFGGMTWPHRLVRVMLAEQIYRAVTILVKHPYHRP